MQFLNYLSKSYHRNLLEKLLFKYSFLINGKILDIGSKNRRYDHFFNGEITAIDIIPKPELDIIEGNLTDLHFESNSFDSVICFEVFQYLEPEIFKKGFNEIYRILKKKGNALVSLPFYCWEHMDNIRVTLIYLMNYFKELKNFEYKLIKIGNRYTSVYDMIRFRKGIGSSIGMKNFGTKIVLFLLYLIIKGLSLDDKQDSFYSGYLIILTKK